MYKHSMLVIVIFSGFVLMMNLGKKMQTTMAPRHIYHFEKQEHLDG